jgi:hypothetical protein
LQLRLPLLNMLFAVTSHSNIITSSQGWELFGNAATHVEKWESKPAPKKT